MYPQIYNSSGERLAVLDNIIKETASIKRVVNGEFTFAFEAFEKELKSEYFDKDNSVVIDGQTFDIKYIEQKHDVEVTYSIQCEHVNYRMQDGEDNLYGLYIFTGTPSQILANILSGSEFSVGTVSYTTVMTLVVNAEITRKALIYELANSLGGEIDYTTNGFTINILNTIGQNRGFQARFGKNLKGVSKIIDNRGELKTYYDVDVLMLKNSNEYIEKQLQDLENVDVGDTIRIIDDVIGLNVENRVKSIEYNPIFELNTKLEITNTLELITTKITQIERSTVKKEAVYNGVKVGPDEGFVAERSDSKAKTIMNATEGISIYSDVGAGLVRNFFVDTLGRIQGKQLTIDANSEFHGEVNIANGLTSIVMAPDTGNPFAISYNGNDIFKVTAAGLGTFYGGGRFFGEVDVANGSVQVKIAPTGGNPFEIKYGTTSIMSVDTSGNANFHGTITASAISGGTVTGATISGGTIDVETDIYMGGQLHINGSSYGAGITWDNGYNNIYIDPAGHAMTFSAPYLYWGADLIATRTWASGQFAAASHSHSYATSYDISSAISAHVSAYHSGP